MLDRELVSLRIVYSDFVRELWVSSRIPSVASEKRRDSYTAVDCVVVHELGSRQERHPVILIVVAIHSKILLDDLVYPFCLPVGLWMVRSTERMPNTPLLGECSPCGRYELSASVRHNMVRYTEPWHDSPSEKIGCVLRSGSLERWCEDGELGEPIDDDEDQIETF